MLMKQQSSKTDPNSGRIWYMIITNMHIGVNHVFSMVIKKIFTSFSSVILFPDKTIRNMGNVSKDVHCRVTYNAEAIYEIAPFVTP